MSSDDPSKPKPTDSVLPPLDGRAREDLAREPAVEIELCDEVRDKPQAEGRWTMVEVWTQNRLYKLDVNLRCIEVVDRHSERPDPEHGLLGARLLGGQHTEETRTVLTHPFPRPGTEAVFEQTRGGDVAFSHSSTVTRVVLRLRSLDIRTEHESAAWDQIAGEGRSA